MKFIATVAMLLSTSVAAYALTDQDYERFIKESPAFSQAENRMNGVWKRLKSSLSKEQYADLLVEQRNWLKERDSLADKRLRKSGGALVDAYTAETHKRAEELETRIPSPLGNGTSVMQTAIPAQPVPAVSASVPPPAAAQTPAGPLVAPPVAMSVPAPGDVPSPAGPKANSAPKADAGPKPPVVTTPSVSSPARPVAQAPAHPASPIVPGGPVAAPATGSPAPAHLVIGTYLNDFGSVMITNTATGYTFELNTAAPDGNWVCSAAGQGKLEGDVFTFALPDGAEPQMLRVRISGKTLSINREMNPELNLTFFCGNGGSLEGQYTKR